MKKSTKPAPVGITMEHLYLMLGVLMLIAFSTDVGMGILAILIWYASGTIGAARVRRLYMKPKSRSKKG